MNKWLRLFCELTRRHEFCPSRTAFYLLPPLSRPESRPLRRARPGLLIPSLKSDPRRRHGLLFTNENCKYERAARVSTSDHSRGRGQLIIASKLIKSGKHANALFIFQSDGRSNTATTDRAGDKRERRGRGARGTAQGIRIYKLSIKMHKTRLGSINYRFTTARRALMRTVARSIGKGYNTNSLIMATI